MDIEDIIVLIVVSLILVVIGMGMLAAGLDYIFSIFYRFDRFRVKKFKWIKTKAKIVKIEAFSPIRPKHSNDTISSYTVVYYDENVRYVSHILKPERVLKGKYVYIYYKKNKPQIIREVKRPTPKNIPVALVLFLFAVVSLGFGIFLAMMII